MGKREERKRKRVRKSERKIKDREGKEE
jgi:hypothetical protein